MRRIVLSIISLIVISLYTFSQSSFQIDKPDFAKPRTTLAEAEKSLAFAQRKGIEKDVMAALLVIARSEMEIDYQSIPQTIARIRDDSRGFNEPDLQSLAYLLRADLTYRFYSSERWKFDNRDLPLTPLSNDMTQWSGKQFKMHIYTLIDSALVNAKELYATPISKYPNIIEYKENAIAYFPTVLDFCLTEASTINALSNKKYIDIALEYHTAGSLPWMWWKTQLDNTIESLSELVSTQLDNPNCSIALIALGEKYSPSTDPEILKEYCSTVNKFLTKFPECSEVEKLKFECQRLLQQSVDINFGQYFPIGKPFEIIITSRNCNQFTINAYKTTGRNTKKYKKISPAFSKTIDNPGIAPFKTDTTLTAIINESGNYVFAIFPGEDFPDDDSLVSYIFGIEGINVYPFLSQYNNEIEVITCDPVTGKPLDGVKVIGKYDSGNMPFDVNYGTTNDKGRLEFKNLYPDKWFSIIYNYNGIDNDTHKNISPGNYEVEASTQYSIFSMTDRSIYHRGDSVQFVSVLYMTDKIGNSIPIADQTINVKLMDVNSKEISQINGKTDAFGRFSSSLNIPKECLSGTFTLISSYDPINANGVCDNTRTAFEYNHFIVSDYKLPKFDVNISSLKLNSPEPGFVTMTGEAKTFSGIAVANADVNTNVKLSSWWARGNSYGDVLYNTTTKTDSNGIFTITIPQDSIQKENDKFRQNYYEANVSVTSISGETQEAFRRFTFGKPYRIYALIDPVINRENYISPQINVIDADENIVKLPLKWNLSEQGKGENVIAAGIITEKFTIPSKIAPGNYNLSIFPENTALADTVIFNIKVFSYKENNIKPLSNNIFLPVNEYTVTDDNSTIKLIVGCSHDDVTAFYQSFENGKIITNSINLKKGWNEINIPVIGLSDKETSTCSLLLFGVKNLECFRETFSVKRSFKQPTLTIETAESFRDKLIPGSNEQWHFTLRQDNGETASGALVLDMFNRALDTFAPHSLKFSIFHQSKYFSRWVDYLTNYKSLGQWKSQIPNVKNQQPIAPQFAFIGDFPLAITYDKVYNLSGNMRMMKSSSLETPTFDAVNESATMNTISNDISVEQVEEEFDTSEDNNSSEFEDIAYRDSETPLALWKPMLTAGQDGIIDLQFTVPNANTSWKLLGVAWNNEMNVGRLSQEFTSAKPIMVTPNIPRFVRAGDIPVIRTIITNNTDSASVVKIVVEVFNPMNGKILSTQEYSPVIVENSSDVIVSELPSTIGTDMIGIRIRGTMGCFTDGEQNIIPILPCEQTLVETNRFYLNPNNYEWSMNLPDCPLKNITLEFTENPVWTVVSALPGLINNQQNDATSFSASLFSAAVAIGLAKDIPGLKKMIEHSLANPADSTLVSPLEKNEWVKTAVLDSTPWVQAAESESARMSRLSLIFVNKNAIDNAIKGLSKLQANDGGWRWGEWSRESSQFITMLILERLGYLRQLGYLPKHKEINKMITSALSYLDNNVENTNPQYTLIRSLYYNDKQNTANGKNVINKTIAEMKKGWKNYPVGTKANIAEIMWQNGNKQLAKEIINSIGEYAVVTSGHGAEFPSSPSLKTATNVLRAYNRIAPKDSLVDDIRQNLIIRKRSQNWGSSINTTDAVASILSCGTKWTSTATASSITVGDTIIVPSKIETVTGHWLINLSKFCGETLTISKQGNIPSYGCLYTIGNKTMVDVEATEQTDLKIEKSLIVQRDGKWVNACETNLNIGDHVRVTLTIKNDAQRLDYVVITDERPAAFEPVNQLSEWIWSEGIGFYRENNDSTTNLFVDSLPKGTYILTYDMYVNSSGTYTSGVATLQSQYAPEYAAHSSGSIIKVIEKAKNMTN